jgi:hypothetical protein
MALDAEVTSQTTDSASTTEATSEATPSQETKPSTGYSATDPGSELNEPVEDELAALIAENTKVKPSATADDASETETDGDGETEETAETSAGDESADDISDELLDRAIAVGYELDDIREFKDAKALEKELSRVEKLRDRLQGKKAGTETATETEPEPESKEPDWNQLIEDGHDPDIIALQKSNWQRATAAEAMVKQLQQVEQTRAQQAVIDRFDDALNDMGKEYESILGKGRAAELMKSSPEAARNRSKVFTTMTILRNGYQQSGQPVPPEAELIQQAFQASFHSQLKEIARKSIKNQIKNAGSQALSRPRSGSAKELPGPERALVKEREFWKQHS